MFRIDGPLEQAVDIARGIPAKQRKQIHTLIIDNTSSTTIPPELFRLFCHIDSFTILNGCVEEICPEVRFLARVISFRIYVPIQRFPSEIRKLKTIQQLHLDLTRFRLGDDISKWKFMSVYGRKDTQELLHYIGDLVERNETEIVRKVTLLCALEQWLPKDLIAQIADEMKNVA